MRTVGRFALALAVLLGCAGAAHAQVEPRIPSPEAHFGFRMGTDRELVTMERLEQYFELVANQSDRVELADIGPTTEGHRTIAAIISSSENVAHLDAIRAANRRLADPRTLTAEAARNIIDTQKVVVAIGASIHASEVGATQASNELLYTLATSRDPAILRVLQDVVVILIPSLNPDGYRLVVDWYTKTKGTPYEGGPMPWLYHKYAGHDINRDAFMMNLAESRNLARFFYGVWHPQIFLTMHQMEENGPRFFVPPNTDPIDLNYDPLLWRSAALLGDAMAFELQRDRRQGVLSSAKYDYYWPGFEDSAPLGHNTVCLLTEAASVAVATAVTVVPSDLRGDAKGLPEYKAQINFPDPWPGGRWTLRDIVEYELTAVNGLLVAASAYRVAFVQNFYDMGSRAVEAGRRGGPFAFVIPPEQHDPMASARLKGLLIDGAIEIQRALEPFTADGRDYPAGTDVIFLAQPYRSYVKTLLETQRYPARRGVPGAPPERPYDVAGWTLPAQMGVDVRTIDRAFEPPALTPLTSATIPPAGVWGERRPAYWIVDARGNGGARAVNRIVAAGGAPSWTTVSIEASGATYGPGSVIVPYARALEPVVSEIAREFGLRVDGMKGRLPSQIEPIGRARTGLYRPWTESIDEGWTRWVLDQHEFRFSSVSDAEVRAGKLRANYDVIILPNMSTERMVTGFPLDAVPAEFSGGLGREGVHALDEFVRAGGTLICLGQASSLALDQFALPVRDIAREPDSGLFIPGSILRLEVVPGNRLTYGMAEHTAAFFAFSSVFESRVPLPAGDRATAALPPGIDVPARYAGKDVLISGWLEGESSIAGRAAVVQVAVGTGRVVLLGFPVQHRGQSLATFRLLFNPILAAH